MDSENENEKEKETETETETETLFTLPEGIQVPVIGWTCFQNDRDKMEHSIDEALTVGYRHIFSDYSENEDVLGHVLNKWFEQDKLKREDIFISAKLPYIGNSRARIEYFMRKTLKNLQLDYVDLYSVSSPVGFTYNDDEILFPFVDNQVDLDRHTDLVMIWKTMELLVDCGLARSIGVTNFNAKQLKIVMKNARIPPVVLEVECHAHFQQEELREVCKKYELAIISFLPFGFTGKEGIFSKLCSSIERSTKSTAFECLRKEATIVKYSLYYDKSPEQILIRFLIQSGILINTPTCKPNYLKIFDFELTDEEVNSISRMDKGLKGRTFDFASLFKGFDTHPENPFRDPF